MSNKFLNPAILANKLQKNVSVFDFLFSLHNQYRMLSDRQYISKKGSSCEEEDFSKEKYWPG